MTTIHVYIYIYAMATRQYRPEAEEIISTHTKYNTCILLYSIERVLGVETVRSTYTPTDVWFSAGCPDICIKILGLAGGVGIVLVYLLLIPISGTS